MSKTKNTPSNKVSNNNIIIIYDLVFSEMELQLDNKDTGIITVVNKTK
jgi:hypothetical protein